MQAIHKRQTLIQEKRKKTDFRHFLREIASRCPVNLYKIDGKVSRYPQTDRLGALVTSKEFMDGADKTSNISIGGSPVLWKTLSGAFIPVNIQLAMDVNNATKVLDGWRR